MKNSILIAVIVFSVLGINGQEIPDGVRYKKAPDAVNNATKASLESALSSDSLPKNVFGDVTVVGPMLWKSLKPSADKRLQNTMPLILIVSGQSVEGKRIGSGDELEAFWKLFRSKYPGLKDGKIRKGNVQEISYYWATIPFDIEEPFWVIEAGTDRFITNFTINDGKPRLLWIDRVDDLKSLMPKAPSKHIVKRESVDR